MWSTDMRVPCRFIQKILGYFRYGQAWCLDLYNKGGEKEEACYYGSIERQSGCKGGHGERIPTQVAHSTYTLPTHSIFSEGLLPDAAHGAGHDLPDESR